jgi:integrase
MLALIRAILREATLEWDWLDKVPKIRLSPEPSRRIRWITRGEVDSLLLELPDHLKAMVRFSLETGLRQANVTGLQWSQVVLITGVVPGYIMTKLKRGVRLRCRCSKKR